jgi:hypothetical protein
MNKKDLIQDNIFGDPPVLTPEEDMNARLKALEGWRIGDIAVCRKTGVVHTVQSVHIDLRIWCESSRTKLVRDFAPQGLRNLSARSE